MHTFDKTLAMDAGIFIKVVLISASSYMGSVP